MKKLLPLCALALSAVLFSSCAETQTTAQPVQTQQTSPGVDYRKSSAEVVVLNLFDMYCIHCQKDAKNINELQATIHANGMSSKIKIYGIGVNNTQLETDMYKKRYNVTYPLTPDKNRAVASRFGKVRAPLLIVLKKEGGQWKEVERINKTKGKTAEIYSRIQP